MVMTILSATVAFLLGVWIANRYGRHVFLRNREIEEPTAETARILSKQELDWAIIHIRDDLGFIAALLMLVVGLMSALIVILLTK
ncbi:MAG TPA: hypothetical protein VGQ08_18470 [Nitrospiraceae bacterium]|jgi:hypothetical protein|nr:hypothetical protein [Nitrospiraceae bacterium]